jgi:hypothetical protein
MTDILDDSYESDLTDEEHERLILMSEHAIAKPLSPAAQAVQDAAMQYEINPECYSREIAAAALRAAADQVVPLQLPPETAVDANHPTVEWHVWNAEQQSRFALLAIANELEAQ